jgi:hypothetical protein
MYLSDWSYIQLPGNATGHFLTPEIYINSYGLENKGIKIAGEMVDLEWKTKN